MFAFSQVDPRTNGQVSDMEVPINRYLSSAVEQGQDDSIFNNIYKMRELSLAEADPNSRVLSPEDANNKYSLPGLKWDSPVKENVATLLNQRKQAQLDRQFFLSQDNHDVVSGIAGMGAQMAGSLMNPLDLGLLFVPVVGEGSKFAEGANVLGKGALMRGIISRSALEEAFPRAPRLAESMIQGLSYQAVAEGVNIANRVSEGGGGGKMEDLAALSMGALFTAGLHLGVSGAARFISHLSEDAKAGMAKKAMDDFVKGKQIDVTDIAKMDEPKPEMPSVPAIDVPQDVQAFANNIGFSISKTAQAGGVNLAGLPPELAEQLLAAVPREWEFTDRRPGSPSEGYSFYFPEGTSVEQMQQIAAQKIQNYIDSHASEAPITANTAITPEVLNKIRTAGAKTKRQIQELFPNMDISREEASVLRDKAWKDDIQDVVDKQRATTAEVAPAQVEENKTAIKNGEVLKPDQIQEATVPAAPKDPDVARVQSQTQDLLETFKSSPELTAELADMGYTPESLAAAMEVEPKAEEKPSVPKAPEGDKVLKVNEPEKVVGTAVKDAEGNTHIGSYAAAAHATIVDELQQRGVKSTFDPKDFGFISNKGRFLTRDEAAALAGITEDVKENPEMEMHAPDMESILSKEQANKIAQIDTAEANKLWYHGTGARAFNKFKKGPAFFTDTPQNADWYAQNRGDKPKMFSAMLDVKNPLDIGSFEGVQQLVKIAKDAGVDVTLTGDVTNGWELHSPDIKKHSPYAAEFANPFDLAYIPKVREALKESGYDALKGHDTLENTEIPTMVTFDPEQVSIQSMERLDPATDTIKAAADCLIKKVV